jgi:transcriptional regulator with XRE-family HTH domain
MKIGHLLKLIRARKEFTQKEMADRLGISQNYLSLIESYKKAPRRDKIAEFAKKLNISKEALFFASSEVPEELSSKEKKDFQKLQQNILAFLLFDLNEELKESA